MQGRNLDLFLVRIKTSSKPIITQPEITGFKLSTESKGLVIFFVNIRSEIQIKVELDWVWWGEPVIPDTLRA
jgi:hypothetical protein